MGFIKNKYFLWGIFTGLLWTIFGVITIVFFDSLWIKTNKGMTRALINEISTFVEVYDNEKIDRGELKNLFSLFLDLNAASVANYSHNTNVILNHIMRQ